MVFSGSVLCYTTFLLRSAACDSFQELPLEAMKGRGMQGRAPGTNPSLGSVKHEQELSCSRKAHLPQFLPLTDKSEALLLLSHISISLSFTSCTVSWLTESLVVPKLNSSHSHCCQFSALLLKSPFF